MEIVTAAAFEQRIEETWQAETVDCNWSGFDTVWQGQHYFSHDSTRVIEFRPDLALEVVDDIYHRSVAITGNHDDSQDLVSKFYLSGYHRVCSDGIANCNREYSETAQQSYLFYLPKIEETEQYFAGDRVQLVRIYWGLEFLRTISQGLDILPLQLKGIVEGSQSPRFHIRAGHLTDEMRTVLQQLVLAPYQGAVQRLYLESKMLEVLALQLVQIQDLANSNAQPIPMKPTEIEQIYHAKDILLGNLLQPPTILDLSQQVGLHHMKLKKGFRQVFGTTVFGYLYNYRMELAQQLLYNSQLSVTAIAETVGYANQGHFAAAFRRKFGISPSACRRGSL